MTLAPADAIDSRWQLPLDNGDLRLIELGTSARWGQGLWPKDKACLPVARELEKELGKTV